jgi:hypothetical protein
MAGNGTTASYTGPERRVFPWTRPPRETERRKAAHTYLGKMNQVAGISCTLRRDPGAIVEVARGTQLQVAYGGASSVELTKDFGKHSGSVLSGSEWVLVRTDGVVLVDARVTISFATDVLMDMTLKGTIDLKDTFGVSTGDAAYQRYKAGTHSPVLIEARDPDVPNAKDRYFHRITGSVRFEGGSGRVDPDYNDRFLKSASMFKKHEGLELLVRQQFNVVGKVFIDQVPHYDPNEITLAVWSWG